MELQSNSKSLYDTRIGKLNNNAEIHFVKAIPVNNPKEEDVIYFEFDPREIVVDFVTKRIKAEKNIDIDYYGKNTVVISKEEYEKLKTK